MDPHWLFCADSGAPILKTPNQNPSENAYYRQQNRYSPQIILVKVDYSYSFQDALDCDKGQGHVSGCHGFFLSCVTVCSLQFLIPAELIDNYSYRTGPFAINLETISLPMGHHAPQKTSPTWKTATRVFFWLPLPDLSFSELVSENDPIPIVFAWPAWHDPPRTPVLIKNESLPLPDLKFSKSDQVMISWQLLCSDKKIRRATLTSDRVTFEKYRDTPPTSIEILWLKHALSLLEVDCTPLICKHASLVFIMLLLQRYRARGGGALWTFPKKGAQRQVFWVRISSGGLGVFRVNRWGSKKIKKLGMSPRWRKPVPGFPGMCKK